MKIISIVTMIACAVICFTGCEWNEQQQTSFARTAGTITAATWRGVDNPSNDEINDMKNVIAMIQDACCTDCGEASFYDRVYPLAEEYINAKVKVENQAICKLGASFILTGLDTAFAANPAWKETEEKALKTVNAFCEGVQIGLQLSKGDPIVAAATRQTTVRTKIMHK